MTLFDRHVPEGVLFDNGWSLWGPVRNPGATVYEGTGYENGLRVDGQAAYAATLSRAATTNLTVLQPQAVFPVPAGYLERREEMKNSPLAGLTIAEFPSGHGGGIANSYAFQGAVFSPEPFDPANHSWTFHRFERLGWIASIADFVGVSMYYNIGAANNEQAFTGCIAFNHQYPLEVREMIPPLGSNLLAQSLWAIAANRARYVSTHVIPLASSDTIRHDVTWPHFVYDPTHPQVVRLCMAHVRDFVQRFSTAKGFFLRGEWAIEKALDARGAARITSATFTRFAPITNFAPHLVAGFREYMARLLGGDNGALQARWGMPGITFPAIDVRSPSQWTRSFPMVANDYVDFQAMIVRELDVRHYLEAKRARPQSWCSILGFAAGGVQRSALGSDFASSGAWIGATEQLYFRGGGNGLTLIADAARLSGKPMAFAISSSTYVDRAIPPNRGFPWFRGCFREIRDDHVRLYFREALTAGISHLSYVKAYGFGLVEHLPSVHATNRGIQTMRDLRSRALEFMGPVQQVAIHADSLDNLGEQVAGHMPSTFATWRLSLHLRPLQVPAAVFSDARMLQRTFSRWHLRRALTFVVFPEQLEERARDYVQLLAGAGTGGAVFVVSQAGLVRLQAWLSVVRGTSIRVASLRSRRVRSDWATLDRLVMPAPIGSTRCHVLAFRNQHGLERIEEYLEAATRLAAEHFDDLARLTGIVRRPAMLTAPGVVLTANSVSDGLNSLLAVSWVAPPQPVRVPLSVQVDDAWRLRFDGQMVVGFDVEIVRDRPGTGIGPSETRFVHVEARLHPTVAGAIRAGGLTVVIGRLRTVLVSLRAQLFDVDHGFKLLEKADGSLSDGHFSRALAAVVALSKMVFLRATRAQAQVTVDAVAVWRQGAPSVAPVENGEAQVILSLHDHEVQPSMPLTNGRATLPVLDPRTPRWDFDHGSRYAQPRRADVDQVIEVHVTDQRTGGHGFVTLAG